MLVDVAAQTKAALEANRTLRCLAEIKYRKESRRSPDVISWGEVGAFCCSLLEATGLEMEHEMQMLMVSMSVRHKSNNEPIHFLFAQNKTYYIRRHSGLDTIVSSYYAYSQGRDKGPLPYFTDHYNPPIYCDGKRMEHGVTYFGEPIKLYVPGDSDKEE
ncbi:hypothetical protein F503_00828 [Ophiostoma piceae UAMH 11346]|uniref:Uncharacterized protein n=1 Tax=Ophiostoma piceae (strain UAMH 11346) TaxID=1262450 RepID=S3D3V1_OPHP1|nr:hypothetical protein F503_00828 [Ophiostoma piceae UAMH 11346]